MPDVPAPLAPVTVDDPLDVLLGERLVRPGQNRASQADVEPAEQDRASLQRAIRRLAWPVLLAALFVAMLVLGLFVSTRPMAPSVERPPEQDTNAVSFASCTGNPAVNETYT